MKCPVCGKEARPSFTTAPDALLMFTLPAGKSMLMPLIRRSDAAAYLWSPVCLNP